MLNAIQTHLARGARRALWASVGMVLLLTGLGFLTVALWLVLSAVYDGQFAALVIGLGYVGAGLIVLGIGAKRPETKPQCPDLQRPATGPFEQVMIAFFEGVQAGKMARK